MLMMNELLMWKDFAARLNFYNQVLNDLVA